MHFMLDVCSCSCLLTDPCLITTVVLHVMWNTLAIHFFRKINYYYYYYIRLTAFFQNNLDKPAPEKQNRSGKTNLDLLEQEIVSCSGISWAICKSAPCSRQITMPASHHSVFYRLDALPATQPTTTTTAFFWPFVRDHMGELVPEETFTHSHLSWLSIILCLLPPSTTIHSEIKEVWKTFETLWSPFGEWKTFKHTFFLKDNIWNSYAYITYSTINVAMIRGLDKKMVWGKGIAWKSCVEGPYSRYL